MKVASKLNAILQMRNLSKRSKDLPIVSPHGHCDPSWFAENKPFENPASLLVTPDHYVFRMLYSQGIGLEELGIGNPGRRQIRAMFFESSLHIGISSWALLHAFGWNMSFMKRCRLPQS